MSDELKNAPTIELEQGPESITLYKDTDGFWVITHHGKDVTTQGETVYEALLMLADALCGVNDDSLEELQETAENVFDPTQRKGEDY